jgi:hypothetical protein
LIEHKFGSEKEEDLLRTLSFNLVYDIPKNSDFFDPSTIANILLQCYFRRKPVPVKLQGIQIQCVLAILRLIPVLVDVIAANLQMSQDEETEVREI